MNRSPENRAALPAQKIDPPATRTTQVETLVHRSIEELLADRGYSGVTMESVSKHSGVAKTTLYRRWSSKAEMVFEQLIHLNPDQPALGRGVSLEDDLRLFVRRAFWLVAEEPGASIVPGLIADMRTDPELVKRFKESLIREALVEAARLTVRWEIGDRLPSADLLSYSLGWAFTHVHVLGRAATEADQHRVAAALLTMALTDPDAAQAAQ